MLALATPDASVTGVALACGFHNGGHFAKDYREAFGELPSLTLARARTLVQSRQRKSN
jgi:transcriptional regulator GlxA family with amidase domain